MKKDFVVIGGGVAGLCAACRLVELGLSPLVIEAGHYPSHKVCGEFFSPESLAYLKKWDVEPIEIKTMQLYTSKQRFDFPFPQLAGSLSHLVFDPALVHYAKQRGAEFLTQTRVESLTPKQSHQPWHEIKLSNGETIKAHTLLIATGRLPGSHTHTSPPMMKYVGIKAHFMAIPMEGDSLKMFSFPGAYAGISPIEGDCYNIACLVKQEKMGEFESPSRLIQQLMSQNSSFYDYLSAGKRMFPDWMQVQIPEFGLKPTKNWPDTYFIGDAAGTIPPASGNGLSMAISSGYLAANYAKTGDYQGFKKAWYKRYARSIYCGKLLHQIMLRPHIENPLLRLASQFPPLAELAFKLTRT